MRCRLWLAESGTGTAALCGLLDKSERSRRAAMHREEDRARFTAGAALIRLVVGEHIGTAPGEVRVSRDCPGCAVPHGRPRVPGSGLHLSLSHSGRLVVLAVTTRAPVGVDIEARRWRNIDGLWRMISAPGERRPEPEGFTTLWCRKESVLKATGDGLRTPMTAVRVSPPDEPPVLLGYGGRRPVAAMGDFVPAAGYAGAVTVLAEGPLDLEMHRLRLP